MTSNKRENNITPINTFAESESWYKLAMRRLPINLSGVFALLAISLAITIAATFHIKEDVELTEQHEFDFTCNEIHNNIIDRLNACELILRSGAGFFDNSEIVTRKEWHGFIDRLQIEKKLPGIQGIGFTALIPKSQLNQHIQEIQSEGFPDYQVKPAGEREFYTAIKYIEPFKDRNLRAFGYDMFTESVRRKAMERARDENTIAMTGKVTLVQETDKDIQAGALMYFPLYRHGMTIDTVEQRRNAIYGWVYTPYRMTDLMRSTLRGWDVKQSDRHIYLQIYDGSTLSGENLLYNSQSTEDKTLTAAKNVSRIIPIDFAGRRWTLLITQLGGLASTAKYSQVWFVLSGGLAISFLLFGLAFSLFNTQKNARKIAAQLTEELKNSEGMQRLLLDSMAEAVYGIDMNGKCTFCNNTCIRLLGYSNQEELIGRNMHMQIHSKHADGSPFLIETCRIFKAFREGIGTHVDDEVLWRSDGTSFPAEYWSYPLFQEGKIVGAVVTFIDITERKRTEEKLAQLTNRLALALKAGKIGIWELDIKNDKLSWDDQMFSLYGISKEKFDNIYKSWLAGIHPDDLTRCDTECKQAIRGEKEFDTEFRIIRPDGTIRNIRALGLVLNDETGSPARIIGTNWDITDIKKAEAEAQNANISKSEFLANMSHEIRTPLNGVIGFTGLLIETKLNPVQKQYAQNANTSAHTLLGIINDILDFSKIEAGKLELEMINTDVIELLEQTIDVIKFGATQKGLELLLNIPADTPRYIITDPVRLRQILVNLASNAVKFTEKGEIEISVKFEPCQNTNVNTGKFIFSVRDTGIGISKSNQSRLFKAFSQADPSTTRKFGGSGLGLVISNMLSEKLGGPIQLESDTGKGSKFYFSIITTFENTEPLPTGKIKDIRRALIVDDNENNRTILLQMFTNWHIEAQCASTGFEALEKIAKSESFDIIIIDYNMPYMNGIETIRMIRKNYQPAEEKTPEILIYSSNDAAAIHDECVSLGVRFKLVKPVKTIDLYKTLCTVKEPLKTSDEIRNNISIAPAELYAGLESGKKILIVDDVAMNMNLTKAVIVKNISNAQLIEAATGLEAVDKFQKYRPDIIFMDIQMPEMDGYTATAKIRAIENEAGGHVPIIALTAGVIKGEREKCLAAGMDDYLSKPIEFESLKIILKKYILFNEHLENNNPMASSIKNGSMINRDIFDVEKFKKYTDGQNELMKIYISTFNADYKNNIHEISAAINMRDAQKLRFSAHKFKGAVLVLGAAQAVNILSELEIMGKNGITEGALNLFEKLKYEIDMLTQEIKKLKL
ncbi:MAG: CHASE domain-containing protein [Candidatus Wallbacteria bacterium]